MLKKILLALRQVRSDLSNALIFKIYHVKIQKPVGHIEGTIAIRSEKKGSIQIGQKAELRSGKELCSCLQHIIYDMTIDELVDMSSKAIDTGKDFSEENMSKRYFDLITQ